MKKSALRFIDLFAGLGGIRLGLESAASKFNMETECVFTSEIKEHAISAYNANFPNSRIDGDITKIDAENIPNFDILLAGFPCQAFSYAGKRKGFEDTRGTLFFDVLRILKEKSPQAFILENVEGLADHDRVNKRDKIGRTLSTILRHLKELQYVISWKIIDASQYGTPQRRKRIYIVGTKGNIIDFDNMKKSSTVLKDILEENVSEEYYIDAPMARKLLSNYTKIELEGKRIKDKRGGPSNIHSWDLEIRGSVTQDQKLLLNELLKQRRKKEWASLKDIPWSDGMPLTLDEIASFDYDPLIRHIDLSYDDYLKKLKNDLEDLVNKRYLSFEVPKKTPRNYRTKGYNIVTGKLSFDISEILNREKATPTLVATDVVKMAIVDVKSNRLRRITKREGLRLFGFPEWYSLDKTSYKESFDLLGNSVCVKTLSLISEELLREIVYND